MVICKVKILANTGWGIVTISWKFLRHNLLSGYRNGHGIHSPFVYDLVRNVLFNHAKMERPEVVVAFHKSLRRSRRRIEVDDQGAGSRVTSSTVRTLSSIARYSSVSLRQGLMLHRLARWYQPSSILEFGTGLGISTAYIASGASDAAFISIEGSLQKYKIAKEYLGETGIGNVDFVLGNFDDHFPSVLEMVQNRLFVFIDGDHRYHPTVEKVRTILNSENLREVILILDDIYWSNEMERAWRDCCNEQAVRISIDLFYFGVLIKRAEIAKQHFRIKI